MPAFRASRARRSSNAAAAATRFSPEDSDSDMDSSSPPFLSPPLASSSAAFALFPGFSFNSTTFASNSNTNISPSALRKQACTNCRRRKRRCDLAKPSCGQCASSSSSSGVGGSSVPCIFAPVPSDVNDRLRTQKRARRARLAAEYILLGASAAAVGIGVVGGSDGGGNGGLEVTGGQISRANSLIGGVSAGGMPRTGHLCTPRASFAAELAAGAALSNLVVLSTDKDAETPTPTTTVTTPSVLATAFPNALYHSLTKYSIEGPAPSSLLHLAFYPASPSSGLTDDDDDYPLPPALSAGSRRGGVSAGGGDLSMASYPCAPTLPSSTSPSAVVTPSRSLYTGEALLSPVSYTATGINHQTPVPGPSPLFDPGLFSPASAPPMLPSAAGPPFRSDHPFRSYPLPVHFPTAVQPPLCSPLQSQSQLPLKSPDMSSALSASSPDSLASVHTGGSSTGSAVQTPGLQWLSPAATNGGYIALPSVLLPRGISSTSTAATYSIGASGVAPSLDALSMHQALLPTTYFSSPGLKSDSSGHILDFPASLRSSFDHALSVTISKNNNRDISSNGYFGRYSDHGRAQAQWGLSSFERSGSDGDLGLPI